MDSKISMFMPAAGSQRIPILCPKVYKVYLLTLPLHPTYFGLVFGAIE